MQIMDFLINVFPIIHWKRLGCHCLVSYGILSILEKGIPMLDRFRGKRTDILIIIGESQRIALRDRLFLRLEALHAHLLEGFGLFGRLLEADYGGLIPRVSGEMSGGIVLVQ